MVSSKPLCIDLFCGLFGWGEAFAAEGWEVIGFDIADMCAALGRHKPENCRLILQDVLTITGEQLRRDPRVRDGRAVIVASPPCQRYSYMAMPWDRAKREIRWQQWQRDSKFSTGFDLNDCFNACFRIAKEAGLPLIVENAKGAQPWIGRASWHYGGFYLWGDLPALMPSARRFKNQGGSWFAKAHNTTSRLSQNPDGRLTVLLEEKIDDSRKGLGGGWFEKPYRERGDITGKFNSKSNARRAASAEIAKIPPDLAQWIARVFMP